MHAKYLVQVLSAVLMAVSTLAVGAGKYYCKIGADPVNTNRQVLPGEMVIALPRDLEIPITSGSGHICHGWLKKGELVVISRQTGKLLWIKRCGNEPVGDVFLTASSPRPPQTFSYEPPPARSRQASATPISFNFRTNPEAMEPYDDCVGSCRDANAITRVAIGALGQAAIGYGISKSGDRITNSSSNVNNNNGGGAVVTPPSPPPGHGGSTNPPPSPPPGHGGGTSPPPVVVDPPFVYPGNGSGTNPPVVQDPPFVYPGNGGGTNPPVVEDPPFVYPGNGGGTNPPVVVDPPFVYPGYGQGTPVVVEDPPFVYPGHGN